MNNMVPMAVVYVNIGQALQNCKDLHSLQDTIHEFSVLSLEKEEIGTFEMIITAESDIDEQVKTQAKQNLSNATINYSNPGRSTTASN